MFCRRLYITRLSLLVSLLVFCETKALQAQDPAIAAPQLKPPVPGTPALSGPDPDAPPVDKRVLGVLPNYRTAERTAVYKPITAGYKIHIALKDSFDTPLFFIGAMYATIYQAEDSHPEFGQGLKGYFHRLATSYSDQVIGNMFTEGIFPIILHEDPRYFRMSEGKKSARLLYAVSRIFVTKTDAGNTTFNFSEVLGNGAASAIGLSYYPDSRSPGSYVQNWSIQLATDATSQVLKEFWPDMKRHWLKKHPRHPASTAMN